MYGELNFSHPFSRNALSLQEFFARKRQALRSEIVENASRFLTSSQGEVEYVQLLIKKYTIEAPQLDTEHIDKASRYENTRDPIFGRTIQQMVVTFSVPFIGELQLIQYIPRSGTGSLFPHLFVRGSSVCFEVTSKTKDAEEMRKEKESNLAFLKQRIDAILPELAEYNHSVEENIAAIIEQQKKQHNDDNDFLDKL